MSKEIIPANTGLKQNTKKLFIKTYGCQMNVYDSERMKDVLAPIGYAPVASAKEADLIVLNTCHIREKAAEKVYSELGRLRKIKQDKNPDLSVVVAGCVAQAEGEEIMRRAPVVDLVVGPQSYHKLPEMIARVSRLRGERLETEFDTQEKFDQMPKTREVNGASAFLSVQEGCDKFCTFCVVPYTRGAEFSRPVNQIINEARDLVHKGVKEITLLGQNVNAYHGEAQGGSVWDLADLIRHMAKIGGLERIRYTTSHPNDMSDNLLAAHGEINKLMPYLHLPLQAGSDRILRAMNRKHTFEDFRNIVKKLRSVRPDIALSSDFIVGFPGESELDFQKTMQAVEEIGFASSFSFKYSPRPGTPGAAMAGQVDESVKSDRLARLQNLLYSQQTKFNQSMIGRVLDILVESKGRDNNELFGRAPYLQGTHFSGTEEMIGKIVKVEITEAGQNSLRGVVCG